MATVVWRISTFRNFTIVNADVIISIDKEILGGQSVFAGTRVPDESLFDHLEAGISLNDFLDDFPSVKKEHANARLEVAN